MYLLRSKWPAAKARRGSDTDVYRNRGATRAPGHFHRNPMGRGNFGVFVRHLAPARLCRPFGTLFSKGYSAPLPRCVVLRCLLGQYRNGYCRFARALKNAKIPFGKCIAIYQSAHEPLPEITPVNYTGTNQEGCCPMRSPTQHPGKNTPFLALNMH